MRSLNCEDKDLFEYRFKRSPKKWTIPMVHDLWMKTKIRSKKKQKDLTDFLNWIVANIKPNDGRSWIVFFDDNKFYHLEKTNHLGVSYRIGHCNKDRESKINSIIIYSDTIEIGKQLRHLERMTSHLDYRVKTYLDKLIYSKIPRNNQYHDMSKFIRINGRLYLYNYTIRTNESKIVTEILDDKIIDF